MIEALENLKKSFDESIKALEKLSPKEALINLHELKVRFIGKKSEFASILRSLGELPAEERPKVGAHVNKIKKLIEESILLKLNFYKEKETLSEMESQKIDVTLPGSVKDPGTLHPITLVEREIIQIFSSLGFDFVEGIEIEDNFHNFEALNIPENHPSRDMQDTFYISEQLVLRSHTSNAQIRVMEKRKPPIRIISCGRVYRSDYDATHTPMFTQLECLLVDKNVSFAELKGTLNFFVKKMFGEDVNFRLRSSYFPFTEPSAEMDICCIFCKGAGCNLCKGTGWLEILGCGMVNPKVFESVGYDPSEYCGFALGMGLERITMLKYGINDIRSFFDNDIRMLNQF